MECKSIKSNKNSKVRKFKFSIQALNLDFSEGMVVIVIEISNKYFPIHFPFLNSGIILLIFILPSPLFIIVISSILLSKSRYSFKCYKTYLGGSS